MAPAAPLNPSMESEASPGTLGSKLGSSRDSTATGQQKDEIAK